MKTDNNLKKVIIIVIIILFIIMVAFIMFSKTYKEGLIENNKEIYSDTNNTPEEIEYTNNELSNEQNETLNTYNKEFGSYQISKEWVESVQYSTNNKFFYVKQGEEKESRPNNISINEGKNKYSIEQHMMFRTAILRQLSMQVQGKDGITINANGRTTESEIIVYTFNINDTRENVTTTQYYIVGDYKYILVHETVYGKSEETDNIAKDIINSFKWK